VTTTDRTHPGGLAVAQAAGVTVLALAEVGVGGVVDLVTTADLVLDALVGIGGDGTGVRGEAGRLLAALDERWAGCVPSTRCATGAVATCTDSAGNHRAGRNQGRLAARRPRSLPSPRPVGARGRRPLVVAVDVPSGTGVDDGTVRGTVLPADLTVTFGAVKPGLLLPPGDQIAGRVETVDIGLDFGAAVPAVRRLGAADVAALWPVPGIAAHKYSRGVLGLVAGTTRYPGAAVLAAEGAVATGVGMVRFVDEHDDTGPLAATVLAARPEVVVGSGRVQAWAAGSGVDPADPARRGDLAAVLAAARSGVPTVLDAGALVGADCLGPHVVLTPHAGELADLLTASGTPTTRETVEAAPLAAARAAHQATGATVLLKGQATVVVGPGAVYAQADASAWLATAGAGDVLTGILGAQLAGCASRIADDPDLPAALAAAAALVHGRAAHQANPGGPVSAAAVARAIPATVAALLAA
jgi:NAD(P)H-hydrate repair Nnr-like enzyme with NAD(P)H-hydrate dehydratase domain